MVIITSKTDYPGYLFVIFEWENIEQNRNFKKLTCVANTSYCEIGRYKEMLKNVFFN